MIFRILNALKSDSINFNNTTNHILISGNNNRHLNRVLKCVFIVMLVSPVS